MKLCKLENITGNIHSIETFGTHEGPGIRFVIFLQGCIARCLYCQNPDTWGEGCGKAVGIDEIMENINRCLPYIVSSKGGVTVSGGEPLLQIKFLCGLFKRCRDKKIHTAIDTSAFYRLEDKTGLSMLLSLTDLFMVDIKAVDEKLHKRVTSRELSQVFDFISLLEENKKQYWVRYVLVPGLNDSEQDLEELGRVASGLRYCSNFEFLPYHTLGRHKWEHLGLVYPLGNMKPAVAEDIKRAERLSRIKAL